MCAVGCTYLSRQATVWHLLPGARSALELLAGDWPAVGEGWGPAKLVTTRGLTAEQTENEGVSTVS